MAYSNRLGRNPIKMSNDIEIRSGTSGTGETVANEYIALGYEPGVGSEYMSTAGELFIHSKAGTDANTWYKVTDTPEPDVETHSVTAVLAAKMVSVITKLAGVTALPSASYNKVVNYLRNHSGSVTLGADAIISINP